MQVIFFTTPVSNDRKNATATTFRHGFADIPTNFIRFNFFLILFQRIAFDEGIHCIYRYIKTAMQQDLRKEMREKSERERKRENIWFYSGE